MKIKVWCDTETNAFSIKNDVIDLDDYCVSDEEWEKMTERDKYKIVEEWAISQLQYGFEAEK